MENILIILATGIICLLSFILGSRSARGEHIKIKSLNPVKAIKNYKENKEYKQEQEKINVMMRNIDNYDGTSNGQEDIPN